MAAGMCTSYASWWSPLLFERLNLCIATAFWYMLNCIIEIFFFFFLSIILYYLMNIYMQIHSLLYMEFNLKSNFFVELYWDAN